MSGNSVLRIHTKAAPQQPPPSGGHKKHRFTFHRLKRRSSNAPPGSKPSAASVRHTIVRTKPDHGERLLRNSAIACAVLLGILTLGNIDQPWAKKATEGIEKALTMHIDLDDTIGELTFVKELMPESALVFLNTSGKDHLDNPVEGTLLHPWSELQPWLMFDCTQGAQVTAVEDGTVTAVSPASDGKTGVLVDHGNGLESVYAYLADAAVENGDPVVRGQTLGTADNHMYFEWRVNGESIDPSELMGLEH